MTYLFVDKNPSLSEFVAQIKATPELQPLFEVIQKDCAGTNVNESTKVKKTSSRCKMMEVIQC